MAVQKRLKDWEVALVKAMIDRGFVDDQIQAYFTRPGRTVNHARFGDIRKREGRPDVAAASAAELDAFLVNWRNVDPETGLDLVDDELVIKARESMIAAVHTFNSAGHRFRTELFVVTSIIAWTYLLHAHYKREGIDYRYKEKGAVKKTPSGQDMYWELERCLKAKKCPLETGAVNNLRFLNELRHEIVHRSTSRDLDDAMSAKLQACCINFNETIKRLFGEHLGLDKRLSVALQFVTYSEPQAHELAGANLPSAIGTMIDRFHERLTEDEQRDPKFRVRVALTQLVTNNANRADYAYVLVPPDSPEAAEVERMVLKETERPKFRPKEIWERAQAEGFDFNRHDHMLLWKQLDAKNRGKGYGVEVAGQWFWYESWIDEVLRQLRAGWKRESRDAA